MADYYIDRLHDFRDNSAGTEQNPLFADVVFVFTIPDANNAAGVNWRTAYLQLKDPEGQGIDPLIRNIDDLDANLREQINTGVKAQHAETVEFEDIDGPPKIHKLDLTDAQRLQQIITRGAEIEGDILAQLQKELGYTGQTSIA